MMWKMKYRGHTIDVDGFCLICKKQIREYKSQGFSGPDNWEHEDTPDADKPCLEAVEVQLLNAEARIHDLRLEIEAKDAEIEQVDRILTNVELALKYINAGSIVVGTNILRIILGKEPVDTKEHLDFEERMKK